MTTVGPGHPARMTLRVYTRYGKTQADVTRALRAQGDTIVRVRKTGAKRHGLNEYQVVVRSQE